MYGGDGIFIEEEPLCCGSYDEETDTYDDSCCSGECCITLTEYMYGKGPNNAVGRLDDDENEGNFMARGKASNVAYYSSQKTYIDDDEENANTVSAFHRAHTHTTNNENQVNCRISTTDGGNQSATATRNNTVTVSMTMATLNLEAGSSSNDSEEDADRRSEAVTELADEPTQEMRTSRDIEVSSMNNEDSDASSNDRTTSAHPADETRRSGGENVPTHEEVPEKHKDVITDKSSGIKGRRRISDGGTSMQTQDKGDKFPTRAIPLRSQRTSISLLPDLGKSHRISAVLQAPQSYNSLTSPSASFNPMSNPNPNPLAAASPTSSLSSAVTPIMLGRTSGKRVLAPLRNTKPRKSRSKIKNTDSNRTNIKSSIAKACTDTHLAASSLVSARNISTGAGGQQEDSAGHTVGSACDRRNAEVRIENTTAMPEYVTNEDSNTAADNERAHTENERWPVREEKKATENETETDQDRESCEISQNVFVSDEERNGSADEFNVCGGNNDPERSENRQDIYYDIDENKGNVNGADEKDASEQTTDEAGNRKAVDKTALSLDHPTIESSTKKGSTGKGHRRGTSYDTHIDAILNDSDESVDSDDSVSLSISLNQHSDSEDDASDNEPLTGLKDIDINTEDECSRSEFESGGENSRRRGRRSRRQRKKRGRCSAPSDIDVEESRDIGSFLPSRPAGPYPLNNTTNIPVSDMQSHTARTNATSLSGLMDDLNDTLIYENSIDGDDHNNVASGNVDEDGGDRYVEMGRSNEPFSRQRNAGSRTDRSSYSVVSAVSMGSRMSNETSYTNTTPGPVPSLPSRSPSEPTSLDPHQPPPNPHSLKNGRSATSSLLATSSSLRIHSDNKSIINRSGFISLSIETGSHRSCGKLTAGTVPPASAISASSVDQTDDVRIFGNNYARYHSRSKSHVTPLSGVGSSSHDHPEVKADTLSSNSIHGNVYRVHSNDNHDAIEGKGRNRVKQRRRRRRADRTNAGHRRRPRDSARTVTARKRDRGEDDKSSDSSEVDTLSDSSQNHDYSDSDGDLSSSTGADSDSFDDSNEEIDTNHLRGLSSRTHTPSALSVPPTPPALPAMPSSSSVSAAAASSNPYSPLPPAFSFTPNTGSSTTNPLTSPTNNGVPPMPPPLPSRTGKHHQ